MDQLGAQKCGDLQPDPAHLHQRRRGGLLQVNRHTAGTDGGYYGVTSEIPVVVGMGDLLQVNRNAEVTYRGDHTPPLPSQSNQLRGLTQRSLEAYVAFFSRHPPVPQVDPQQDTLLWRGPAVFVLDLVVVEGQPAFKPTFQECDDVVSLGGQGGSVCEEVGELRGY